ncbi:GntR family transcriptional regulator [Vibrio sp.]|nr:GntR family transcriptional regulator [Vibrio sp.]
MAHSLCREAGWPKKKFEFIAENLLSKIYQNQYANKLPPERELSDAYDVSRSTIRKAIAKLEAIGIIEIRLGAGNYIKQEATNKPFIYNSITENSFEQISYQKLKLHKRLTSSQERQALQLEKDDFIWFIKRLRLIDGKPIQIEETKLPVYLFPKMNESKIENSLQKYALEMGLKIDKYLTTYRAINISKEAALTLSCKRGSAAMHITNRGFLKSGEVFIVSEIIDIDYHCTYQTQFSSDNIHFRDKYSQR